MSKPRRIATASGLVLATLALWYFRPASPEPSRATAASTVASGGNPASANAPSPSTSGSTTPDTALAPASASSPDAVAAASARRERMLALMADDPARALAESVSISEYAALPEDLRPLYEKPFHAVADLDVLPVCGVGGDHPGHAAHADDRVLLLRLNGDRYEATAAGPSVARFSRAGAPLHGITLGGRAVVADGPVAILSPADAALVAHLPLGQRDATRDFATGAPLGSAPVVGVAGDRRLLFASAEAAETFNRRLAALETRPGPRGGARALLALPYPADASAGFDWAAAEAHAAAEASAWTETPKSTLFIRADFADAPGTLSQASLANLLNTSVASALTAMSYGKTTVSAVVSSQIVRLPAGSATYATDSDLLHNHARAAYEAIHGAGSTNGYDIVGVQFPSIGASSGGVVYAGLATIGGSRHWLQGNPSEGVVVHEFGHNYGLGHANFWQTSDGSVVGTGSNVEYGDRFDVMGGGDSPEAHFHPQGKALLNWLSASQWTDASVAGSGTYRLHRFDHAATAGATRGLRVVKDPSGSPASVGYYWIGYRPGIAGNPYLPSGAYLLWERPDFNRSWLLDTTPGTAPGRDDAALRVGRTYSDASAGVHLTTLGVGGSGADAWLDLRVELGSFPGNNAPSATFSPTLTVAARTPQLFTVSASDADGDTLAYGWDFGDGSTPANSASASQSWTVGGTYSVSVAVSDMKGGVATRSATITVTDPVLDWTDSVVTSRTLGRTAYLRGRHFVGGDDYVYSSPDRATWSESYLGLNYTAYGFAADSAAFVAVGADYDFDLDAWVGVIHRSLDGRVWQKITLPAVVSELRGVAANGAGVMVAVGDDATILRSVDSGATWTIQTAPAVADLESIDFGDGVFMAVGDTAVFTSTDGASWIDRSSAFPLDSWQSFRVVRHVGGVWYAGGWYSGLQRSTDAGQSWTECAISGSGYYTVNGIASGGGVLLASATRHENSTTYPEFLLSADGLTWNEGPGSAPFAATASLAYADGAFHAASATLGRLARSGSLYPANQAPASAAIRSVATADARRTIAFSGAATDADGDALTYLWDFGDGSAYGEGPQVSHVFTAGGSYTVKLHVSDARGGIATATRIVTVAEPLAAAGWTALPSGTTATLYDIAAGDGRLVAVGASFGDSGVYRISNNSGATWSGGSMGLNAYPYGLAHGNGLFVAVGEDYDHGLSAWRGVIYTSPDGAAWTRRLFTGPVLRDVVYSSGRYLAVGDSGTIHSSTDAITWSPIPSGTTNNLQSIARGPSGFLIAGANSSSTGGTVLTSADGDSWTNTSSGLGTGQGLFEAAHAGDRFLVSGFYAGLRHSTDGGASFATTTASAKRADGFAFANNVYLAVVRDLANSDAAQNLLSIDGANWTALAPPSSAQRHAVMAHGGAFITVGAGGEIWRSAPLPASTSGFADWRAARFPGLPSGSAAGDDPDGDGLKNLVEYALGLDPSAPSAAPALAAEILAGELTLTVPRTVGVSDLHVVFETSTDLAAWTANGVVVVDDDEEITGAVPASPGRRFLRARFTLAP